MDMWILGIPTSVALAAVAVMGYLVGRRHHARDGTAERARRELKRAKAVIRDLETISQQVRRSLAAHHSSVLRFKEQVARLSRQREGAAWQELSDEAERMLQPTVALSTKIAHAYDDIRRHTRSLMSFSEVGTDPVTGLNNRQAMNESLAVLFGTLGRYQTGFSLAIFDIDDFKSVNDEHGHAYGDQVLRQVAGLLDRCVRESDVVARYGGEEFVVIMPQTALSGATSVGERLRAIVQHELDVTISAGVAAARQGDDAKSLLARADAALYAAKSNGRNVVFEHTGDRIQLVTQRRRDISAGNERLIKVANQKKPCPEPLLLGNDSKSHQRTTGDNRDKPSPTKLFVAGNANS